MSGDNPQMRLRLPPELRTQIEEASKNNGRSMNAEIVFRLAETFDKDFLVDTKPYDADVPHGALGRLILLTLQAIHIKDSARLLNQLKTVLNTVENVDCTSSPVPKRSKELQES